MRAPFVVLVISLLLAVAFAIGYTPPLAPAALEQKYATPPSLFIDVDGIRTHYRDEGSGPTLLLVHGTAASLHTWQGWSEALRDSYRVIRMDLPAFGLTGPRTDGDYSVAAYVRFVDQFASALHLNRFHLAGNSLGGLIAWRYTLAHPARVDRLILVDAAGYPMQHTPMLILLGRLPVIGDITPWITPKAVVAQQVRTVYGNPLRIAPGTVDRYYELLLREGNRIAFRDYTRSLRVSDEIERLGDITAPTLILWGELDKLIPASMATRFATDISGSTLVLYPDAGHIPMEEIAQRSVADVRAFLYEVVRR